MGRYNSPCIYAMSNIHITYYNQIQVNYIRQWMNCKNVIIAGFNSGLNILNQYLTPISQTFQSLNKDHSHQLLIVSAQQFTNSVLAHPKNVGICIGGTSVTECYTLNQVQGIRAAVVHNKYIAEMCRKHNDANVAIIATDCIADKLAAVLVRDYLLSGFDQQERNMLRIQKLRDLDEKYGGKAKFYTADKVE